MSWQIERPPGSRVRRTNDDHVTVPLRLSRNEEHATDAELSLTLVEVEHLHAALCRALDGHSAPARARVPYVRGVVAHRRSHGRSRVADT
ncbi:hypothetical protein [Streptomyces sp. NBC_00286]|uniref:hypothetical protein n=1 Tax=Streptomyces sp. NBC_00286 TaxID=2975701 RepID=UPI002E2BC0FC|nr:hypothetical protein [Streptomyces sp. NBC_00286]